MDKRRVLFLCTGNSCRSQMAEGLVNHFLGDGWEALSAGTRPSGYVHPLAIRAMAELDIDISDQCSESVDEFRGTNFDVVITVCDDAAENCPLWLGSDHVEHIGFPDPADATGKEEERLGVFRRVRDGLRREVLGYLRERRHGRKRPVRPRESFDLELERLKDAVLALGSQVENAIIDSVHSLKERDAEAARHIVVQDRLVNERRFELEADALALIATQQPMARDLRTIAAILDIASELERIGDYAKGIARINLMMDDRPFVKPLIDLPAMAFKTQGMLRASLEAFVRGDMELARSIPEKDDEVDALYNQVYRELIGVIVAGPSSIDQANHLLWAAHNLERAADRVTNICERVIFTVSGEMVEMDVEESGIASLG